MFTCEHSKIEINAFFRMVYSGRKEYIKLFHCYIKDDRRNIQTFNFIQKIFSDDTYSDAVKSEIGAEIARNVAQLTRIDMKKTAHVVYQYLAKRIPDILAELKSQPFYYEFLQVRFQ